jgi:hypothetical protein
MTDYLAAFPSQFAQAAGPCLTGVGARARALRAPGLSAGDVSTRAAASLAQGVPGGRYPYSVCGRGGDLI